MEDLFRRRPGVTKTRVGYTGGHTDDASYSTVKTGTTGHAEAIEITYDDTKTSFRDILEFFFKMHDPTTKNRQGNDIGTQYRSAIFYSDEDQKNEALDIITEINKAGFLPGPIVTEVIPAAPFHVAEEYHQDYLEKNPGGYTCHFVRNDWSLPPRPKAAAGA